MGWWVVWELWVEMVDCVWGEGRLVRVVWGLGVFWDRRVVGEKDGTDLMGWVVAGYGVHGGLGEIFRRVEEGFVVA